MRALRPHRRVVVRLAVLLFVAILLAGCCWGECNGFPVLTPGPATGRAEGSGSVTVSAESPVATVRITSVVTEAAGAAEAARGAGVRIDAIVGGRQPAASMTAAGSVSVVMVGFRDPTTGALSWAGDRTDAWADRRTGGGGLEGCGHGCRRTDELLVTLADRTAGPVTVDWTAIVSVTYEDPPPAGDVLAIEAENPTTYPAADVAGLAFAGERLRLDWSHPIERRTVRVTADHVAASTADRLGLLLRMHLESEAGGPAAPGVVTVLDDEGGRWTENEVGLADATGELRPPWQCDGDACTATLTLVYQLASGDPAKPILVDWTVLGWALPADAGDTLPALAAEVVPESTPEAVQVPQAHATLQGTATIKEGRSDSREAFPRLLLTIPAGVSADQVWYRAVLRASARTTGPGGGLAMRLGNSALAPLPAETAGAVAVLGAFSRCEARACTVILQPIFLRTTDDRGVADVAWTLDVDLVALDGDPSVVDAGWDVRLEAYP